MIVLVGGGMAAGNAAATLREQGYDGRLTILGMEATVPFGRPPLSKTYLRGEEGLEGWFVRPPEWFEKHGVELRLDDPVVRVDPGSRRVTTRRGADLAFDQLLLATGVRNRALSVPGSDLDGVFALRTQADCDRIKSAVKRGDPVVIVGMGFIGCEVAASLTQIGARVTAVFPQAAPLERVLGREVATVLAGIHAERGVDLLPGDGVEGFEGRARVEAVRTRSGRRVECAAVISAVGVQPNVEFLEGSGIAVGDGILVDELCRTNAPRIFACGDVASIAHPLFGRVRVEHYNNAEKHGAAAGRAMLGHGAPYSYNFSFWSDQYDQKLEYIGLAHEWDTFVVRGSLERRAFVGFYLRDRLLKAAVGLGRGGDPELDSRSELAACGVLIEKQIGVEAQALASEEVDLWSLSGK